MAQAEIGRKRSPKWEEGLRGSPVAEFAPHRRGSDSFFPLEKQRRMKNPKLGDAAKACVDSPLLVPR